MGTSSGGGSGRSRSFKLPNSGLRVRISSMASFRSNGQRYDGKGVSPDVKVEATITDLNGEIDSVLARAREYLEQRHR